MNLGDGFSRRKQIQGEFKTWINRLQLTGKDEVNYEVGELNQKAGSATPGTLTKFKRVFTTEECIKKLKELLDQDKELALKISLTNQKAKAQIVDMEGKNVELTIPELIVLKNEIAPKLEEIYRSIPKRTTDKNVIEETDNYIKWRVIQAMVTRTREIGENNFQRDVDKVLGFKIKEVTDYGYTERKIFDKIDEIQKWQQRIKEAINQANKTLLVEL